MKIGVIDTDGNFGNDFFKGKNIEIIKFNNKIGKIQNWGFNYTHSEYVCSMIYKENPKAEILLVPVVGEFVKYPVESMISAIYLLIERNVKIINISIGCENINNKKMFEACKYAENKGVIIVASHANINCNKTFPAALKNVIGVLSKKYNSNKMYKYDSNYNNIIVNLETPYVSYVFLNQLFLMNGNSFLTAKFTGFISRYLDEGQININRIVQKLNLDIPIKYPEIRYKVDLIISDRKYSTEQIKYSKIYDNCKHIYSIFDYYTSESRYHSDRENMILIDYSDYQLFMEHKKMIEKLSYLSEYSQGIYKIILRYPYFSTYDLISLNEGNVCFKHYLI